MNVLFLEDDKSRIENARRNFIGFRLAVAETAQQAIQLLKTERFDLASLDHDLGDTQMAASDENSGYAVAQHIAAMPAEMRPLVIVHSLVSWCWAKDLAGTQKQARNLLASSAYGTCQRKL